METIEIKFIEGSSGVLEKNHNRYLYYEVEGIAQLKLTSANGISITKDISNRIEPEEDIVKYGSFEFLSSKATIKYKLIPGLPEPTQNYLDFCEKERRNTLE